MSRIGCQRSSLRHRIVRSLGYNCRESRAIARRIEAFVECLRKHGLDPASYGDLATKISHQPRVHTQSAVQRRARYAELRRLGVSTSDAIYLAKRPGRTRDAIRRLQQGLPLR